MNISRFFAYATGLLFLSGAITIFSNSLLIYIGYEGLPGLLAVFGFGLVYLNTVYVSSSRFIRKLNEPTNIQYYFSGIALLPPFLWVNIQDTGLGDAYYLYHLVLLASAIIGGYFGAKTGLKKQIEYRQALEEARQGIVVEDDLKKAHEQLNKN